MLKEIIVAIQSYGEAHQFILKHRLWKWIILPGILYALLFCVGMYFFWESSDFVIQQLLSSTGLGRWLNRTDESWLKLLVIAGQVVLKLILMFFYFSLFKYLFLIVGSPLFAYLSEKTAAIMEGNSFPFNFSQLLKDMVRGIKLALRNTLWQTVYSICILFISLVPIVGLATAVLSFFVECYYLGFAMLDYSCERNQLSPSQSIAFVGKHKGLAIGNGMVFYGMHLVPVLGWILAPGYGVIAATLSIYHTKNSTDLL